MDIRHKVLVAKVGLDGHNVGAKVIARGFRDAGFEVVYTGMRQTPEMVVEAAIQEDADVIGVSILSGAHMVFLPKIMQLLKEKGEDILVICGGVIPQTDIAELKKEGVSEVFVAGTPIQEIVDYVREQLGDTA